MREGPAETKLLYLLEDIDPTPTMENMVDIPMYYDFRYAMYSLFRLFNDIIRSFKYQIYPFELSPLEGDECKSFTVDDEYIQKIQQEEDLPNMTQPAFNDGPIELNGLSGKYKWSYTEHDSHPIIIAINQNPETEGDWYNLLIQGYPPIDKSRREEEEGRESEFVTRYLNTTTGVSKKDYEDIKADWKIILETRQQRQGAKFICVDAPHDSFGDLIGVSASRAKLATDDEIVSNLAGHFLSFIPKELKQNPPNTESILKRYQYVFKVDSLSIGNVNAFDPVPVDMNDPVDYEKHIANRNRIYIFLRKRPPTEMEAME